MKIIQHSMLIKVSRVRTKLFAGCLIGQVIKNNIRKFLQLSNPSIFWGHTWQQTPNCLNPVGFVCRSSAKARIGKGLVQTSISSLTPGPQMELSKASHNGLVTRVQPKWISFRQNLIFFNIFHLTFLLQRVTFASENNSKQPNKWISWKIIRMLTTKFKLIVF